QHVERRVQQRRQTNDKGQFTTNRVPKVEEAPTCTLDEAVHGIENRKSRTTAQYAPRPSTNQMSQIDARAVPTIQQGIGVANEQLKLGYAESDGAMDAVNLET